MSETKPIAPSTTSPRQTVTTLLLLILILLGAGFLRLTGVNWDQARGLHPDERFVTDVTARAQGVDSWQAYFDTLNSTLNPNNTGFPTFAYGNLPITLVRYIAEYLDTPGYYEIFIIGRHISAIADLITLLFVFLTARHLFDDRVGIIAALFYAFAALPIQQSHFYTTDPITATFTMGAIYFASSTITRHRWLDYPLFGIFTGAAMASKISVFPLAAILIIALGIRVYQEGSEDRSHLQASAVRALSGLVIAGIFTIIAFRVGMPYAFLPSGTDIPIDAEQLGGAMAFLSRLLDPLGMRPNPDWLVQMETVQYWVSGYFDAPPNHQWAFRTPLLFPWKNIMRVGLGWPLGLFTTFAILWALWEIARGHRTWPRLVPILFWVLLIFLWQGSGWVMSMRYFLPIYGSLLVIAAWAIVTLWDRVQHLLANRGQSAWSWPAKAVLALSATVLISGIAWGYAVSRIYTRPVSRNAATAWVEENLPADITLIFSTDDGPRSLQLGLLNNFAYPYYAESVDEDPTQPTIYYSTIPYDGSQTASFTPDFDGTLTAIRFNGLYDPIDPGSTRTLALALATDLDSQTPIFSEETALVAPNLGSGAAQRVTLSLDPLPIVAGQRFILSLRAGEDRPLISAGATIAIEGAWDDNVPNTGVWNTLYQMPELQMAWPDGEVKADRIQYILDRSDYISISSNRFYGSLSQMSRRFPMSIDYYQALFSGELGFELVADFTSRPNIGPLEFNDGTAEEAWTVYDHPRVLIFRKTTAYDSAVTAAILSQVDYATVDTTVAVEAHGRPTRVNPPAPRSQFDPVVSDGHFATGDWTAFDATPKDIFTRFQPLTIILWWLLISLFGLVSFPLLWTLFPGLPDRAYPLSRITGLALVAFLAWMAVSLSWLPWTGLTVLLTLILLLVISTLSVWQQRRQFSDWLQSQRRHIFTIEAGLFALYLFFLLIRLANPDLWHPAFGGEKPMDLAYLNAVLKTTTFPPYNPWFAGQTINYYYFGFVLVGTPLKLLPIPVSLAYNLILPTLYALTSAGAFSAAFYLTHQPRNEEGVAETAAETATFPRPTYVRDTLRQWPDVTLGDLAEAITRQREEAPPSILLGNGYAYLAGLTALLLAVLLGNLDTIRTLFWGLAELGRGQSEWTFTYLPNLGEIGRGLQAVFSGTQLYTIGLGEWYWNATRVIPVPLNELGIPTENGPITEFPLFTFLYADLHAHMIAMPISLLILNWGIGHVKNAEATLSAPRWQNLLRIGGTITLLAVFVGMLRPMNTWDYPTMLALAAVFILVAHFIRRDAANQLAALAPAGLLAVLTAATLFSATATTNLETGAGSFSVTALGAGLAALIGYAIGISVLTRKRENAAKQALKGWQHLIESSLLVGLMAGFSFLFFLPFIQNYETAYDQVLLWQGSRTPVWAYLDIYGLFLWLIFSWLAVEVVQWIRPRVSRKWIVPLLIALLALAVLTNFAASQLTPVMFIALPGLLAAVALFTNASLSHTKRITLVMIAAALSLTLMVELVVLQNDLSRMNTVFKFYLQVWLLMAISAGAAFAFLLDTLPKAKPLLRFSWSAFLGLLVFLAMLYPLGAIRAKALDRWNPAAPHTLDGMAYMSTIERYGEAGGSYSLAEDYEAIRWLQENIDGTPTLVEGLSSREYLFGNRVSIYTGLPAVIGWNWHMRQQRGALAPEVFARHADIALLYNTPDRDLAMDILNRYQADLLFVGGLERDYYDPAGLAKFEQMANMGLLRVIYSRDATTIYQVMRVGS